MIHFQGYLYPALKALAIDPVPNVRLSIARAILNVIPLLNPDNRQRNHLLHCNLLSRDSDFDVQYFATQALEL